MDEMEQMDEMGLKEILETEVKMATLEHRVHVVQMEHKVKQEPMDVMVMMVPQDKLELLGKMVDQASVEQMVIQVVMDLLG